MNEAPYTAGPEALPATIMALASLPAIKVPGVTLYADQARSRYRIQFYRTGRRKVVTLTTTDPRRAYREACELADRFDAGRYDPWNHEVRTLSVNQSVTKYLASIKGLATATQEQRRFVLRMFERTLPENAPLKALSLSDLHACYDNPKLSAGSRPTYFNVLKTWLAWCVLKGQIAASPLDGVKRPRAPKGLPAYFTQAQFKALIDYIRADVVIQKATLTGAAAQNGVEDFPDLVTLAVHTGLRRGEVLHLRWADVDLRSGKGFVHVRGYTDAKRGFTFRPKDTDARVVPLSPVARAILSARLQVRKSEDDTALVFPSPRSGRPRQGRAVSRMFKAYVRDAELPDNLHFHSLRHTFASWWASYGLPIVTLQKWMGHAKIETTMIYADLLPSALEWRDNPYFGAGSKRGAKRGFNSGGKPLDAHVQLLTRKARIKHQKTRSKTAFSLS